MFFSLLTLLLPLVAAAAPKLNSNAITAPVAGAFLKAGEPYTIKWTNVQGPQVTLTLIDGPSNQLDSITQIAENVDNTGSFTWNVPANLARSGTYAIRISYSSNPAEWNYSDRFNFESNVVAVKDAKTTGAAETTAATSIDGSSTDGAATATSTGASSSAPAASTSETMPPKSSSMHSAATSAAAKKTGTESMNVATHTTRRSTYSVMATNMAPLDGDNGSGADSGAGRAGVAVSVVGVVIGMLVGGALL
ncbi:hypothetical protein Dda_0161 [Drechslerella dactyloides]|uniref:Yeast cell wall synthesis Kre9/Knh1-like N-terminal domain-containing protein n=1 Tax=Drechslerella dactyloides TaxID=74499 RepID=A0AAD6NMU8_DREDA|nr:hypothetical protein Dda_0161 [Drechslerella dactyloides]